MKFLIAIVAAALCGEPPLNPSFDDVRREIVQPRVERWDFRGPVPVVEATDVPEATAYRIWYSPPTAGPDGVLGTADDVWGAWRFSESPTRFIPAPGTESGSWQLGVQAIVPGRSPWDPPSMEGQPVYVQQNP